MTRLARGIPPRPNERVDAMSTNLRFEIKDSNSITQPYFWRIIGRNGYDELAKSETLVRKDHAIKMAQLVKSSANRLTFETFRSNYGHQPWSWRVWDGNGKIIIASSETYANEAGASSAAWSVKLHAATAEIVDLTRTATQSRY